MKKTQKLKLTIEDITIETTFDKLPAQVKFLAERLESDPEFAANNVIVTSGNATLFVSLDFIGKRPKAKVSSLFGYKTEEFMAKQYN
ncbi:hypothetical protein D3C81_2132120 [compost metagenome]